MPTTPNAPQPTLDPEAVWHHFTVAVNRETPAAIWTAMVDIPPLLTEIERLAWLLTRARTDLANLLAASQATLAAHDEGEPDPLSYVRDEVTAQQTPGAQAPDGQASAAHERGQR